MKRMIKWLVRKTGGRRKIYLLKNPQKKCFEEVFCFRNFWGKERIVKGRYFDFKEIKKQFEQFLDQDIFTNSPLKKDFWEKASLELKRGVFFSHFCQKKLNYSQIVNVEIDNWFKNPFFQESYQELVKEIGLKKVFWLRRFLKAASRTKGYHELNFRFENIHLIRDIFLGKHLYAVHWDFFPPNSFPLSWLKHRIKDR